MSVPPSFARASSLASPSELTPSERGGGGEELGLVHLGYMDDKIEQRSPLIGGPAQGGPFPIGEHDPMGRHLQGQPPLTAAFPLGGLLPISETPLIGGTPDSLEQQGEASQQDGNSTLDYQFVRQLGCCPSSLLDSSKDEQRVLLDTEIGGEGCVIYRKKNIYPFRKKNQDTGITEKHCIFKFETLLPDTQAKLLHWRLQYDYTQGKSNQTEKGEWKRVKVEEICDCCKELSDAAPGNICLNLGISQPSAQRESSGSGNGKCIVIRFNNEEAILGGLLAPSHAPKNFREVGKKRTNKKNHCIQFGYPAKEDVVQKFYFSTKDGSVSRTEKNSDWLKAGCKVSLKSEEDVRKFGNMFLKDPPTSWTNNCKTLEIWHALLPRFLALLDKIPTTTKITKIKLLTEKHFKRGECPVNPKHAAKSKSRPSVEAGFGGLQRLLTILDPAGSQRIARHPKLEILKWSDKPSEEDARAIVALLCSPLRRNSSPRESGHAGIESNLKQLKAYNMGLFDSHFKDMCLVVPLEKLVLNGNPKLCQAAIHGHFLKAIENGNLSNLQDLSLNRISLGEFRCAKLCAALLGKCTKLNRLTLVDNNLSTKSLSDLTNLLTNCPALHHLEISSNENLLSVHHGDENGKQSAIAFFRAIFSRPMFKHLSCSGVSLLKNGEVFHWITEAIKDLKEYSLPRVMMLAGIKMGFKDRGLASLCKAIGAQDDALVKAKKGLAVLSLSKCLPAIPDTPNGRQQRKELAEFAGRCEQKGVKLLLLRLHGEDGILQRDLAGSGTKCNFSEQGWIPFWMDEWKRQSLDTHPRMVISVNKHQASSPPVAPSMPFTSSSSSSSSFSSPPPTAPFISASQGGAGEEEQDPKRRKKR